MEQIITTILTFSIFISHIAIVIGIIIWIVNKYHKLDFIEPILSFIKEYALWILFLIPASAISASLFYSEYVGFIPCEFCWYQRIMIYPQALLVLTALIKKSRNIIPYLIPLSIIGGIFSIYQYIGQMSALYGFSDLLSACGLNGSTCSDIYILSFGYITIPLMTLTMFLIIIVVSYIAMEDKPWYRR
jgi:disulfide bond formation protein DsbB